MMEKFLICLSITPYDTTKVKKKKSLTDCWPGWDKTHNLPIRKALYFYILQSATGLYRFVYMYAEAERLRLKKIQCRIIEESHICAPVR